MVRIDVKFYREVGFTEEEMIEQAPLEASLEAVMSAEIVYLGDEIKRATDYIVDDSSEANEEMKEEVLKNLQNRKEFLDRMMIKLERLKDAKDGD